jgi:hypothetical protein
MTTVPALFPAFRTSRQRAGLFAGCRTYVPSLAGQLGATVASECVDEGLSIRGAPAGGQVETGDGRKPQARVT